MRSLSINEKNIITKMNCKSADDWNFLGSNQGPFNKAGDYFFARYCYEKALSKDPNHAAALYHLSLIYYSGCDTSVNKNIEKAKELSSKLEVLALKNEKLKEFGFHKAAIRIILQIEMEEKKLLSADAAQWNELGRQYFKGAKGEMQKQNYYRALCCFEKAIKAPNINECPVVFYNLGYIHHHGFGIEKDITQAKKYYQEAEAKGFENAKCELLEIEIDEITFLIITANDWIRLGTKYDNENKNTQDYVKARYCYEQALKLVVDIGAHRYAYYNLANLYYHGRGVNRELKKAKEYYQKAEAKNHSEAKRWLLHIEMEEKKYSLTDADHWDKLGLEYDNAEKKDRYKERICYEKALEIDPNNKKALYHLGYIYHYGQDTTVGRNVEKAKDLYQKAEGKENENAKRQLLHIEMEENKAKDSTADKWNSLGCEYHGGKTKPQDFFKARYCFEKTIENDSDHMHANHNLGIIYHYAEGVNRHLEKAKDYYQRAEVKGHEGAKHKLLHIEIEEDKTEDTIADKWKNLGCQYYDKKDKSSGYFKARYCFEKVLNEGGHIGIASCYLGHIYFHGFGIEKDISKAKEYYLKTEENGLGKYCYRELVRIEMSENNASTAEHWNFLGVKYFEEKNQTLSLLKAKYCFENVIDKSPNHPSAQYRLGLIYHYGWGAAKDLIKAKKYYQSAANQGEVDAKRKLAEIDEMDELNKINKLNKGGMNVGDSDGNTPLHNTIIKQCFESAKLAVFISADPFITNRKGESSFALLLAYFKKVGENATDDAKELMAIFVYYNSNKFNVDQFIKNQKIIEGINKKVNEIRGKEQIVSKSRIFSEAIVSSTSDVKFSFKKHNEAFKQMLSIPELKPLLQITSFAFLGLHDLGGMANNENKKLQVVVDPNKSSIYDMTLGDENWKSKNGGNVVGGYDSQVNKIFLGGRRLSEEESSNQLVRGTLIHEITHFVADEVFKNNCNPYSEGDSDNFDNFRKICDDFKKHYNEQKNKKDKQQDKIHSVISSVFGLYAKEFWHRELIVRVPQLIAMAEQGKEYAVVGKKHYKGLLDYYNNVFLPACIEHLKHLHFRHSILDCKIPKKKVSVIEQVFFGSEIENSESKKSYLSDQRNTFFSIENLSNKSVEELHTRFEIN